MPVERAFIFDLDGTLLDSLADLAHAVNHALAARGCPAHPEEAYRYFVGNGMRVLVRRAAPPECPDADLLALARDVETRYAETWNHCTRPYPGVSELLRELRRRGVPVGVLSNKPHEFTCRMVAHFFPEVDFFAVYGQRAGVPVKPDPTAALHMVAELATTPDRVCFVGDSRVDMETAVNAGMIPVGVTWGFRPREELLEFGAKFLIDKAEDVLAVRSGVV